MAIQFPPNVTAGTVLVQSAIQSPDYMEGISGWTINQDGSAEFNDLNLRGTFNGNDYVINSDGQFYYSDTPAAGNLMASIAAEDGTDPYGNNYFQGVTSYAQSGTLNVGEFANLSNGSINVGQIGDPDEAAGGGIGNVSDFSLASGTDSTNVDICYLNLASGSTGAVPGAATNPRVEIGLLGSAITDAAISGAVIKSQQGNPAPAYTWQAPSYATNFAAGSVASASYQNMQYRFDAEDNLIVEGTCHATAALAAGAYTLFTLPAAYRPKKIHAVPGLHVSSADAFKTAIRVNVANSGAVGISTTSAIAVSDGFYFSITVPLGNIS
jgi:hypothetical protein